MIHIDSSQFHWLDKQGRNARIKLRTRLYNPFCSYIWIRDHFTGVSKARGWGDPRVSKCPTPGDWRGGQLPSSSPGGGGGGTLGTDGIDWCINGQCKGGWAPGNQVMLRAKKVVSDSPGLMDFAIGLVILVLNLTNRQVLFWGGNSNYRSIVINSVHQKGFWG